MIRARKIPTTMIRRSEDHLAAELRHLREEDRDGRAAELLRSFDRRGEDDGDHRDVCDDPRRARSPDRMPVERIASSKPSEAGLLR